MKLAPTIFAALVLAVAVPHAQAFAATDSKKHHKAVKPAPAPKAKPKAPERLKFGTENPDIEVVPVAPAPAKPEPKKPEPPKVETKKPDPAKPATKPSEAKPAAPAPKEAAKDPPKAEVKEPPKEEPKKEELKPEAKPEVKAPVPVPPPAPFDKDAAAKREKERADKAKAEQEAFAKIEKEKAEKAKLDADKKAVEAQKKVAATIYGRLESKGSFKTLLDLFAAGGITTLKAPGNFTIFAPTDEAFSKFSAYYKIEDLKKPQSIDTLRAILSYHLLNGNFLLKSVKNSAAPNAMQGDVLPIKVGDVVTVGNARVIDSDGAPSNGTIYVIDTVLVPPSLLKKK